MIKRMVTGVVAAALTALAFGAVAAPEASATGKPQPQCVWIWTAGEPTCHLQ
ncbi:putative membrane protein [Amycolatopsis lexingtonensis]|uniref:Membrane protein n=1 Tax=Amycolatopsis lexingtonensis TaxID=218822 RepID=A0ABR9I0A2_9PSEU|nr:hypothetical protein [Amycolatopsis lexingtonensis]MBE1496603.1 putative membrane protein [Amycolatopsis lexingtonensis]